MKISYYQSWNNKHVVQELSPELSKIYTDIISFNEGQKMQEKHRELNDKLTELRMLDNSVERNIKAIANLIRTLNEG